MFVQGDATGAKVAAEKAAHFSSATFGTDDWRAMADELRLRYYSGARATSNQAETSGRSVPAARALAEDMSAFFDAVQSSQGRDLLPVQAPADLAAPIGPAAKSRVALVIGNNDYLDPEVPKLRNAVNDARSVRQALEKAGFTVEIVENANLRLMADSINAFVKRLGSDSVALFYYSGHAIQLDSQNFLIPVDFHMSDEAAAKKEAFSLSRIHEIMVNSVAAIHIVILDACRNSAFGPATHWFDLAPMPIHANSLIAFSTEGGGRASDGRPADGNGPYAKHLVAAIDTPGLEIRQLFERVKKEVMDETKSQAQRQVPWSEEDLLQDFYFYPPRLKWNAKDGLEYILVPKGTFQMGCVPADNQCLADENPRHAVAFSKDIWLGRTEVTVSSYKLFADATKRPMPAPIPSVNDEWRDVNHPIVKISWNDANAFCQWSGGRLPTEAEWEYSARAGQEGRIYGESLPSKWRFTGPVAESASNSFGLLGMTENAEEWVADWYGEHAYDRVSLVVDPQGPASGRERVVRGGSWAAQRRAVGASRRKSGHGDE